MTVTESVPSWAESIVPGPFFESDDISEIYPAYIEAFGTMANVGNDGTGNFNNKFASLGAVLRAVRAPLSAHGLAVMQAPQVIAEPTGRSIDVATRLIHKSGQWIQISVVLPVGGQADVWAVGSAMTYAKRYGLLALLGVATEDDDGTSAAQSVRDQPPAQFAQVEQPTVTKAEARRRILTAVGGEPGVAPPDEVKALYEAAWQEFFADRAGPYTESGVAAILGLVPQWLEGRTSQDPTVGTVVTHVTPAPTNGTAPPAAEGVAPSAAPGSDDASPQGDPPGPENASERPEVPAEVVDRIIAEVKAIKLPDVRMRLSEELLVSTGDSDTVRARLAAHRIEQYRATMTSEEHAPDVVGSFGEDLADLGQEEEDAALIVAGADDAVEYAGDQEGVTYGPGEDPFE